MEGVKGRTPEYKEFREQEIKKKMTHKSFLKAIWNVFTPHSSYWQLLWVLAWHGIRL